MRAVEIEYEKMDKNSQWEEQIEQIIQTCFQEEKLENKNVYVSITLTVPEEIRKRNKQYRGINKATDVLSFPMFEREEIPNIRMKQNEYDVLGDIVISIEQVKTQAEEYGHSFERELSYMVVHGFYHLMGYDHMEEQEKQEMREKEEMILNKLNIGR